MKATDNGSAQALLPREKVAVSRARAMVSCSAIRDGSQFGVHQMGLAEWFKVFCNDLQIQDGGTISTRYKAMTRRLNSDFRNTDSDTAHSLYVGSYGRNTAIKAISDLDMVYELANALYQQYDKYQGNGQSALLQAVKTSIERTYSTTSIRADGQVILVPFKDGITFEVCPVFINTENSYTFPDANSGA